MFVWFYLIITLLVFESECSINYSNSSLNRIKRRDCEGFRCKQGPRECIDSDKICDGITNCQDGSDETLNLCGSVHCPVDIFFRCAYGACINLDKKCNGKKDCRDNSDEENCIVLDDKKCRSGEFECDNGECIDIDGKCNGIAECNDLSDESSRTCLNTYCPEIYFKCAYGACVDGNAKCNGIKECYDNSDETAISCRYGTTAEPPSRATTSSPPTNCVTPSNPEHGTWSYLAGVQYYPGVRVSTNTAIQLSCSEGWLPSKTDDDNSKILVCLGDGWSTSSEITCLRKCPNKYDTSNMNVTCKRNDGGLIPCNKAIPGTTLTFKCRPYYEPRSRSYVRRCQANGDWNKDLDDDNECIPSCGEKKVTATKLIVNGTTVERGHYPWTVAIYQHVTNNWEQICGGSLISLSLVLTAAHCVTTDEGELLPAENYEIAAGKYFRPYLDQRDLSTAQYSKIKNIIVHEDYQGRFQNYKGDIAIFLLRMTLKLSPEIQPVCLDKSNLELVRPNQTGIVTGWGFTGKSDNPSDTLQELELPYKDERQCQAEMPYEWFLKYYKTGDKICAGYYDRSTSVCQGDSGGGLVFSHSELYEGERSLRIKYHVVGVVSIGRQEKNINQSYVCDIQRSALYTKVPRYLDWIKEQISLYP